MSLQISVKLGARTIAEVKNEGSDPLIIEVGKTLNKRDLIRSDGSFDIMLRYLKYMGLEQAYYELLVKCYNDMIPMPDATLSRRLTAIVKLFKTDSINKFLDSENYISPANLREVFDDNIIINKEGSREQTYTKQDYRELVILTIKMKSISLLLARYVYAYEIVMANSSALRIHNVVDVIKDISSLPAYAKLQSFIIKNVGTEDMFSENDNTRVIAKSITRPTFSNYISINVLIYLGIAANPDNDNVGENMVNHLFRLTKNKNAPTKGYIINNPDITLDDDGGNASVVDTYVSVSDIPIGYIEEIKYAFSSMDLILAQTNLPIDVKYIDEVSPYTDIIMDRRPDESQYAILCWIFFSSLESQWLQYLPPETVAMLRMVAYAFLRTNEMDSLADYIVSYKYEDDVYIAGDDSDTVPKELEVAVDDLFALSISKRKKGVNYGLHIVDNDELESSRLKSLMIDPVVRRVKSNRWMMPHKGSTVNTIGNARLHILTMVILVHDNIN